MSTRTGSRDLAVDGSDLLELGVAEGPRDRSGARDTARSGRRGSDAEHPRAAARARGDRGEAAPVGRGPGVRGRVLDAASAASAKGRSSRSTSGSSRSTTRRTSRRTGGVCVPRSASTPERLAFNRQQHSARRAPGAGGERGASRATACGATSPACRCWRSPPTACRWRSRGRRRPALALLHVGWRGLLGGHRRRRRRRARRGRCAPRSGRRSARAATRSGTRSRRRSGSGSARTWCGPEPRPLDRVRAGAAGGGRGEGRALRSLHVVQPGALLLAPPGRRRDRPAGSDRRCCRLTRSGERYEAIRAEAGAGVTVVAATKYVGRGRARRPRGRGRRGRRREPSAGSRGEARAVRRRVPLALHRASAEPQGEDDQRDVRALPLALLRVGRAAADGARARRGEPLGRVVQVGDRARGAGAFLALYGDVRGLMTMPPATERPRVVASVLPPAARAGRAARPDASCRWARARTGAWPSTRGRRSYASAPRFTIPADGLCGHLESDARLLRDRRGGRLGRGRVRHRGGARADVLRPAQRPPARAAPAPGAVRRLDRPRRAAGCPPRHRCARGFAASTARARSGCTS